MYASSADLEVADDGDGSDADENHKVWSGSQDRLDGIGSESPYDFYSGGASTLSRAPRARQISAPIPVPPPPKEEAKRKKDNKLKNVGSQSLSGTLIRPKPVHASTLMRGPPPPPGTLFYGPINPQHPRQFHTFSHRGYMNGGAVNGPMISMPIHTMPMPVMMPQQYATLQHPKNSKKKKNKDKLNGIPIGMPVPPPMFAYPPPSSIMPSEPRPLAASNRKLAQSAAAGLDESANSGAESPGGTGIYRRKGHLNERAFSYSIRQEHRSRSHGSLASLQFNPPDIKKEREIAQMVAGLELHDDVTTLNRRSQISAVPATGTFGKPRR